MSDGCSCIYQDYDDGPEFSNEANPIARKTHICCECGDKIEVGDKYNSMAGKWDGNFLTFKTCPPCTNIRKVYFCNGWIYGGMWEAIGEHFSEGAAITAECRDELSAAGLVKLQAAIAERGLGGL